MLYLSKAFLVLFEGERNFCTLLYDKNSVTALFCHDLNRRVTETTEKTPLKAAKFSILFYVSPANA